MIADGVIPSNVKEGYLARLVLRRTIRFIKDLKLHESLGDIMKIQLDFLSITYPEIKEQQTHILNVINLEEKRYQKTISKGRKLVKKSIKDLKKENKNEIPVEMLIKLYDSHGMPPETIEEISKSENFKAAIPDNFYTRVAEEHSDEKVIAKTEIELNFPETDLIFYDKPQKIEFEAGIIGFYENNVILDRTIFYPEGGGQPSDIGFIGVKGNKMNKFPVLHAEKVQGIVLHRMDSKDIEKLKPFNGSRVTGEIDTHRRTALTQNHTATHLIVAAARNVLGDHVWQAGAQKGVEKSRIDLSHYQRISTKDLQDIEFIANKYVMGNFSVHIKWMNRTNAEKKYGFRLYQGGIVPGANIRTVKIDGIDVQACAGTHVKLTGDIGLIKISRTERIQDGVERLEFSAGEAAIKTVQITDDQLKESSSIFKVPSEQLPKTCHRFFNEWKSFKNEIERLKEEIGRLKVGELTDHALKIGNIMVLSQLVEADMNELVKIATDLTENENCIDVVIVGNQSGNIVGASSKKAEGVGVKVNEIIKDSAKILGGGGGGRPNLAQGAGPNFNKIEEALEFALSQIKDNVSNQKN
jgi:alanyl-tRNA synthetase